MVAVGGFKRQHSGEEMMAENSPTRRRGFKPGYVTHLWAPSGPEVRRREDMVADSATNVLRALGRGTTACRVRAALRHALAGCRDFHGDRHALRAQNRVAGELVIPATRHPRRRKRSHDDAWPPAPRIQSADVLAVTASCTAFAKAIRSCRRLTNEVAHTLCNFDLNPGT